MGKRHWPYPYFGSVSLNRFTQRFSHCKLEKLEQIDPDKMRAENKRTRAAYETKLAKAYYTSPKFLKDTAVVAGSRGAEMGMRQAVGFVFVEIWMSSKEEIQVFSVDRKSVV